MAASKKKKEKAKDFAKANFKLGKGKLKSANATDTSFSSRSIALTQQSITRDNEGVPTTKRNLTLEDLQTQLKHYSSSTRKDALAGLRELFSSYPHLQEESAGTLIPLIARMIGDEEQSVRKVLLAFLSWYLPGLPPIVLQPHHSVLLFFATSSMSHIYPDIRMDAVRALNIMLDIFPESIVLPWFGESSNSGTHTEEDLPNKVLECYLSLLHIRSGIASNGLRTDMSPAAKALVLSSLATFIRLSTSPDGPRALVNNDERALPSVPTWFLAPAFPTRRAYDSFIEQIGAGNHSSPRCSVDYPAQTGCLMDGSSIIGQDSHVGLAQIGNIFTELIADGTAMENAQALPSTPEQLLKILLPILISAFLDSGPTAFSPEAAAAPSTSTAQENALTTIVAVADISRDLWRSILLHDLHRNASHLAELASSMEKMITHMAVYFPFGHDELTKRSMPDATKLQSLNITFCELVALVGISSRRPSADQSPEQGATGKVQSKVSRSKNKTEGALLAMSKYVTSLLGSARSHSILTSGTTVTPQMYIQLLPTIWSLLAESSPATEDEDILRVLIRHFLDLSSASGVKKLAFISTSRLLMLPDACPSVRLQSYGRRLHVIKNSKLYEDFLTALPRYLWELGTKDQELSLSIMAFLRHVITTASPSEAVTETLATFLAPYYMTNHPKRGLLPGPWTSINNEGAVRTLETTWWLSSHTSTNASKTLQTAVQSALDARASQDLSQRWASLTAGVMEV